MYTISEVIKNKFIEEFSTISIGQLLIALVLAFALGVFIVFIYKINYTGVVFSRSFALCLILLSMVTCLVILAISTNVVLSLGMVGALSIVRFRTAVKDPMDTVFMFWAIVTGILTGAGYIPVAIIATAFVGLVFTLACMKGGFAFAGAYLIVMKYAEASEASVMAALSFLPRHKVRSKNLSAGETELVIEIKLKEAWLSTVADMRQISGVSCVNIVSYNGSTAL